MSTGENKLSVLGHIGELRRRLIRSLIVVAITTTLCFIFYNQIFDVLKSPVQDINLIFIEMTEMFGTIMRVALFGGVILAIPYLSYELIMFISPALTAREKKYVYLILPWIALMFAAGVVFCYVFLIPPMVKFLISFGSNIATPQIKIGNYVATVARLLLAVGLVFELPVVTTFLARIGIISPKWLSEKRKMAIIIAFLMGAIITPTVDPINQTLVAAPLVILYEMSIWLAKLVYKKRPATETDAAAPTTE
ncbi:twin-arginine translocase subunit TatC [Chloroflexota bacterium]